MKTPNRFGRLSIGLATLALALAGCPGPKTPDSVPVTFSITVPDTTPADSEVWVSGNQDALGNWNGHGLQLAKQADGTYSGSANFAPGTQIQWKVTRGTWETVEEGPNYEDVDNHSFVVTIHPEANIARLTVAKWRGHTTTGNIKYHTGFNSEFVQPRDIIVWLPPDYDSNTTRHYPVLYMHDGQNLMDRLTASFGGQEWNVDETAQRLVLAGEVEPLIIVGVYNTPNRIPEYTPVADPSYGGGNADNYGKFLKQELKPFIDQTYRTKPEPQYTGVAGSSLGGLVSMYFGLTLNDTFGRIGVISPSVWWDNKDIVTRVNNLSAKPPLSRIWLDIGTNEGSTPQDEVNNARALRDALVAKGFTLDQDLKYLEIPGATHDELSWSARFDKILKYLYPPQ